MKSHIVLTLAAVLSAGALVRAQEPVSPQNHFDAGRYEDAANAITAQPEPPPDAIYLAGRSYLHLSRPDDARAQFGRLSAGVDPPTPWSLVGESALALVDANPGLAVEKASQAVGVVTGSVSSQLPARAGTQRGRAVGTGGGGLREGHGDRSRLRLRALLRGPGVLAVPAARSNGDAPRIFPEAGAERARATRGDGAHAGYARTVRDGESGIFGPKSRIFDEI